MGSYLSVCVWLLLTPVLAVSCQCVCEWRWHLHWLLAVSVCVSGACTCIGYYLCVTDAGMCTELHPALLQCQLIVSEMQHFVQQIQYYINFEVQLLVPFTNFKPFRSHKFIQSLVHLCLRWRLVTTLISFLVCQCVRVWSRTGTKKSLWTRYLRNCSWEFHQIYILGAVGDKDELVTFWSQMVYGQGYSENKCTFQAVACQSAIYRQPARWWLMLNCWWTC